MISQRSIYKRVYMTWLDDLTCDDEKKINKRNSVTPNTIHVFRQHGCSQTRRSILATRSCTLTTKMQHPWRLWFTLNDRHTLAKKSSIRISFANWVTVSHGVSSPGLEIQSKHSLMAWAIARVCVNDTGYCSAVLTFIPLAGSVRTSWAPNALRRIRRSTDIEAGMVRMSLYPLAAAMNANAIPVLPLVGSTNVVYRQANHKVISLTTMTRQSMIIATVFPCKLLPVISKSYFPYQRDVCDRIWILLMAHTVEPLLAVYSKSAQSFNDNIAQRSW